MGNRIVLDLALYKDNAPINDLVIDNILGADFRLARAPLVRFTLTNVLRDARTARSIMKRVIYDHTIELPRINPRHHMKPYAFAYGVSAREGDAGQFFDRLVKVDVRSGERWVWDVEGHFPAEPIFLATPDGEDEDDGILLSIVLNGETATSYLLVLNAKDMSELARAQVPHHIPFGFHGAHHPALPSRRTPRVQCVRVCAHLGLMWL
ncbi:dioxygenase, putative [Acanthamoeba castellanii str. Neff]|uniref:Dioxygenase, putative n=1 Tax=Acanthamoeba castellanii (strain ATCC 30010 / Neff) TaxID=1257118 RepID=L8GEN7_ACACF|nr:dioxygenase, putative [Acanthamoeba castellanii str. Neff]ELR11487.1 dioxygenase, putative [Acanthamoeba castellanii str. Neff]